MCHHPIVRALPIAWILFLVLAPFFGVYAGAAEIPLEKHGGVYSVPVRINGAITLPFILDSGAAEVVIPVDVFRTLVRAGTFRDSDFLPGKTFTMADGSKIKGARFIIRELELDGIKVLDVPASVVPTAGDLLLGQSLLQKLESWTLDNKRHVLIVGGVAPAPPNPPPPSSPQPAPGIPDVSPTVPKVASSQPQAQTLSKMRSFINDCLRANEEKNINKVMSFYADKVNYLEKGDVSKDDIKKDKEKFFNFCKSLSYSLHDDLAITNLHNFAKQCTLLR